MENELFRIIHTSKDNSIKYELIYLKGRKVYGYAGNKTYPKVTQCLLFVNNLLISFGQVIKCDKDQDNMKYALKAVTKKVMTNVYFTEYKKLLWELLDEKIDELI